MYAPLSFSFFAQPAKTETSISAQRTREIIFLHIFYKDLLRYLTAILEYRIFHIIITFFCFEINVIQRNNFTFGYMHNMSIIILCKLTHERRAKLKKYIFTDLACETHSGEGKVYEESLSDKITKISVELNEAEGVAISKRAGRYVTLFSPCLWSLDDESFRVLVSSVSDEIRSLISLRLSDRKAFTVLVAGIGNPAISSDSLGPETVKRVAVTVPARNGAGGIRVCSLIPDVLGNTGMEAADVVRACIRCSKADALIVVDSLGARSYERLATTIQISDGGISPGRAIGNIRAELSESSIGVPVISVGVPTVVNSSTLIAEAITESGLDVDTEKMRKILNDRLDFFVTPKEIDLVVRASATVIAEAINLALLYLE